MNRNKLTTIALCVVFALLFVISCAHFGINLDTPEKKYLGARTEMNLLLEEYLKIQDKVSDADHEVAKAAFSSADKALDTWELMLGNSNYDPSKDVRTWLEAKNIIVSIIRKFTQ